ncbi:MAG: octanoyltransferase [Chromatiales bacterium 21-64-14]|nr:MAG: octanoyltransferase [Chromatiales bacterium 21-64-14]HQU15247.1 lipoyl(octanoyl) transferase LipB [Gammaproteobacteria bacterium]
MDVPTADPRLRHLGQVAYEPTWRAMQAFTEQRGPDTRDELWLLEHPPVYTLGLNGRRHHLLRPGQIPVVPCDRGGQVTYHGPGQLVAYCLVDLARRGVGVKTFVHGLEQAVVDLLADYGIRAARQTGAPGVYVDGAKIAALGLRVRRGAAYHGLSLNVAMDLEPFQRIDPCGQPGLRVTQLRDLGGPDRLAPIAHDLAGHLTRQLRTLPGATVPVPETVQDARAT